MDTNPAFDDLDVAITFQVKDDETAEALHGHDAGMEYLYLRSKTFKSERTLPTRV